MNRKRVGVARVGCALGALLALLAACGGSTPPPETAWHPQIQLDPADCRKGDARACFRAAGTYPGEADTYYSLGCTKGDDDSCTKLSDKCADGLKGIDCLDRICAMSSLPACEKEVHALDWSGGKALIEANAPRSMALSRALCSRASTVDATTKAATVSVIWSACSAVAIHKKLDAKTADDVDEAMKYAVLKDSLQVIWLARVDAEQEASIGATVASIQADKQKQADDAVAAAEAAKEHEREQAERQAAWAGVAKIVSDTGQSVTDALRARAASQAAPTAVQAAPVAAPVSGGAAVTCPAGLVGPQCCEPGTTNDRHCCTGAGGIGTQGRLVAGQACQYFCDCDQSVYNPGQSPSVDACVRGACAAAANRFCRLPENGQAEIPCIPGLVCRHVNGNSERTCVQP